MHGMRGKGELLGVPPMSCYQRRNSGLLIAYFFFTIRQTHEILDTPTNCSCHDDDDDEMLELMTVLITALPFVSHIDLWKPYHDRTSGGPGV